MRLTIRYESKQYVACTYDLVTHTSCWSMCTCRFYIKSYLLIVINTMKEWSFHFNICIVCMIKFKHIIATN